MDFHRIFPRREPGRQDAADSKRPVPEHLFLVFLEKWSGCGFEACCIGAVGRCLEVWIGEMGRVA